MRRERQSLSEEHRSETRRERQSLSEVHRSKRRRERQPLSEEHRSETRRERQSLSEEHRSQSRRERQPRSEEHRSETRRERQPLSEEHRSESRRERQPLSEEHRSETRRERQPLSEEHRSETRRERQPLSEEHRSETRRERQPLSEEHRSESRRERQPLSEEHRPESRRERQPLSEEHRSETRGKRQPLSDEHRSESRRERQPLSEEHRSESRRKSQSLSEEHRSETRRERQPLSEEHRLETRRERQPLSEEHRSESRRKSQSLSEEHRSDRRRERQSFSEKHRSETRRERQPLSEEHRSETRKERQPLSEEHRSETRREGDDCERNSILTPGGRKMARVYRERRTKKFGLITIEDSIGAQKQSITSEFDVPRAGNTPRGRSPTRSFPVKRGNSKSAMSVCKRQNVEDTQTLAEKGEILHDVNAEYGSKLSHLEDYVIFLEEEIKTLARKSSETEDQLNKQREKYNRIRSQLDEAEDDIAKSKRLLSIQFSEAQLAWNNIVEQSEKIDNLNKHVALLQEELSSDCTKVSELDKEKKSLQELADEKTETIASPEESLHQEENNISDHQLKISELESVVDQLNETLNNKENERANLQQQYYSINSHVSQLRENAVHENNHLHEQLSKLKCDHQDKNFEAVPGMKKSTGIPCSLMVEVDDPNMKGAMPTNTGKYAIPTIDVISNRSPSLSYSGSSCSGSSYSFSKFRSHSSPSYPRSVSRSPSRSYSDSSAFQRGCGKNRGRSRSCECHRSRSCSSLYKQYRSCSQSPNYKPHSPYKNSNPESENDHDCYIEPLPPFDYREVYDRPHDPRDPFEREWYREGDEDHFSPKCFPLPGTSRDNSRRVWGLLDAMEQLPRGCNLGVANYYPGKYSDRESHSGKELRGSKEKETAVSLHLDSKSTKHEKHREGKKDETESVSDLMSSRDGKAAAETTSDDSKGSSLFLPPCRDDATPVRDEHMEGDSVACKTMSDKDGEGKSKSKVEEMKQKEKSSMMKKVSSGKTTKAPREKPPEKQQEKSPHNEPSIKKNTEECPPKIEGVKNQPLPESQQIFLRRKLQLKMGQEYKETKSAKEEKQKKDYPREETKHKKTVNREEIFKKTVEADDDPGKAEAKADEHKRKNGEKVSVRELGTPPTKSSKAEMQEAAKPSTKLKSTSVTEKATGSHIELSCENEKVTPMYSPVRKIKINRESGKKIVSDKTPAAQEEFSELLELNDGKSESDEVKTKARRKVTGSETTGSVLRDYTSTSPAGGRPIRRSEEKQDTKKTVNKTMEEYNSDTRPPAEDEIVIVQVPQSSWEKEDYEMDEDEGKAAAALNAGKLNSSGQGVKPAGPAKQTEKDAVFVERIPKTTEELNMEDAQQEDKPPGKSHVLNEKSAGTEDKEDGLSDREILEKEKAAIQPDKPTVAERVTEAANGKNPRTEEHQAKKLEPGSQGALNKELLADVDRKMDGNNWHGSTKKQKEEQSQDTRRRVSPSKCEELTYGQKGREQHTESRRGSTEPRKIDHNAEKDKKSQTHHRGALECISGSEEARSSPFSRGKEKHVFESRSNKDSQVCENKVPYQTGSAEKNMQEVSFSRGEKDQSRSRLPGSHARLSRLLCHCLDVAKETDEAAYEPDRGESDSKTEAEINNENDTKEITDEPKVVMAMPAASKTSGSKSHTQSSPGPCGTRSYNPSESLMCGQSSSASSEDILDSRKKKKKEKKKHKEHLGVDSEPDKTQEHKHEKNMSEKSKDKDKDKNK